jgi:IS30 family transposase
MLGSEGFIVIQALVRRGVYLCDIAQPLGVHPKTIRRALQRGGHPPRRGAGAAACWIRTGRSWINS